MNRVLTDKSETVAWFIFSLSGKIVACNKYGSDLFKFKTQQDLIGKDFREFVPMEIAVDLPTEISFELLTNGMFLNHVNRCDDGSLIATLVKRSYLELDDERYIESYLIHDAKNDHDVEKLLYIHQFELLKCEVARLKNTMSPARAMTYYKPELAVELAKKHKDLTMRDIIFFSLVLCGLQTREVADILCISIDSVYKYRKRLRKKLTLPADKDLYEYLAEIMMLSVFSD